MRRLGSFRCDPCCLLKSPQRGLWVSSTPLSHTHAGQHVTLEDLSDGKLHHHRHGHYLNLGLELGAHRPYSYVPLPYLATSTH